MKNYRIFLVIGGKATPVDNNRMWLMNIYEPLVSQGHDVYLLDIDAFVEAKGYASLSKEGRECLSNELPVIFEREHKKKPFDIFFSYLHNLQIIPDVLKEIKREIYTINYTTNFHQFDLFKEIGTIVDCNIYISKRAQEAFESLGVKSYWMPLASNPEFYKPSKIKNDDVVFIGSAYGPRALLFWRLLQYNVNLHLYGIGWNNGSGGGKKSAVAIIRNMLNKILLDITGKKFNNHLLVAKEDLEIILNNNYNKLNNSILSLIRQDFSDHLHDSLSDIEYVRVLSEAGIVVNIAESRFNHDFNNHNVLLGSNLRDFETTMSGSLLCTQFSEEIAELFDIGKEIICYHNEHDLAEKIKYFSQNVTQRDIVAKSGHERCVKSHTWERRFSDFFSFLQI